MGIKVRKEVLFNIENIESDELKEHLKNSGEFSEATLLEAIDFCNKTKAVGKDHSPLELPDKFKIWAHSEVLVETNRMETPNVKMEFGSTIIEPGDHKKGIYSKLQLELEHRILAWQKAIKTAEGTDILRLQKNINEASALSIALALGKLHVQALIPETAALDSLAQCKEILSRYTGDKLDGNILLNINKFEDLVSKHRYLHYDNSEKRHTKEEALETFATTKDCYNQLKKDIASSVLDDNMKRDLLAKVDHAFDCFKIKNDLNLQVPLDYKNQIELDFAKLQKTTNKISLGLSAASLAFAAASISPLAPITAPAALTLGLASFIISAPGIANTLREAAHHGIVHGISPTKQQVITAVTVPTLLALKVAPIPAGAAATVLDGAQRGVSMIKTAHGIQKNVTDLENATRSHQDAVKNFINQLKGEEGRIIQRKLKGPEMREQLQALKADELKPTDDNAQSPRIP